MIPGLTGAGKQLFRGAAVPGTAAGAGGFTGRAFVRESGVGP